MIVTLGVEEELQVVDARTGALSAHDQEFGKRVIPDGPGGTTGEIHQCTIELQTPVGFHPDEILESLSFLRNLARKRAGLQGQRVLAAGLHPFSPWQSQALNEDAERFPHYAHLLSEYGDIARSAVSFGLHVHVGLPDRRRRIPVMNTLRAVLPEVLALSVSSPFHEGRDTGLDSWRHSLLGRYPRMGIPDPWPDEETYFAHIAQLRRLGSLEPDEGFWGDLRLHHRYGTLEVRICDAIHSLERIWLITALLQCEAMIAAEEWAEGRLADPQPSAWIEENKWRARRNGLKAQLVDWSREETVPLAVRFERWLARLQPAAEELGIAWRLEQAVDAALARGTAADQQRGWRGHNGAFESVVKTLIDATAEPWGAPDRSRGIGRDALTH